ncbi:MAG: 50S ribosomal protein L22 [Candidatus Micrarchaeota archaeon]|nr:50S ribosomal protein L22 [Candidatus Micrarchaeota archaeon]
MPHYGYSYVEKKGVRSARSQLYDVDASYKDLCQVCSNVRGMTPEKALELLDKVTRLEFPIIYHSHSKHLGHRHELGGKKGRYPKKCSKLVIKLIKNALANASNRGLGEDLVIACCSANKLRTYPRVASKGRWARANYETARIEMVLEESPESRKEFEQKKKKAAEAIVKGAKKEVKKAEGAVKKEKAEQAAVKEAAKQEAKKEKAEGAAAKDSAKKQSETQAETK